MIYLFIYYQLYQLGTGGRTNVNDGCRIMVGLAIKKSISIVSPPTLGDQSYPSLHQNCRVMIRLFPLLFL